VIGLLLGSLFAAGCHSPEAEKILNDGKPVLSESASQAQEKHRKDYQTNRKPGAIRWLLGNAIENGMSLKQVNHLLGEEGVREQNSQWIKKGHPEYRVTDVIYHYGPDSQGTAYYLAFREGKLVFFDPSEFHGESPKSKNFLQTSGSDSQPAGGNRNSPSRRGHKADEELEDEDRESLDVRFVQ
jgi:hypothetical protein